MSDYPYETSIDVRFRDLDPIGHVNNAVYATYLEVVRGRYYRDVIGDPFDEFDAVLVHLELEFHGPLERFDTVVGRLRLVELGESSIRLAYRLDRDGEAVATGETVQVVYDGGRGQSVPMPDTWRDRLLAHGRRESGG